MIHRFHGAFTTLEYSVGQRQPGDWDTRSPWHVGFPLRCCRPPTAGSNATPWARSRCVDLALLTSRAAAAGPVDVCLLQAARQVLESRYRFLEQSIRNTQANCVDGTVLFASVLYKLGISPVLVLERSPWDFTSRRQRQVRDQIGHFWKLPS